MNSQAPGGGAGAGQKTVACVGTHARSVEAARLFAKLEEAAFLLVGLML